MAPYCDIQVVSVIVGWPGKVIVKRSSALENSVHSCANDVPEIATTRAADMNGISRTIDSPVPRTGSVPEFHSRLHRIAVNPRHIRQPHLDVARARCRNAVARRCA